MIGSATRPPWQVVRPAAGRVAGNTQRMCAITDRGRAPQTIPRRTRPAGVPIGAIPAAPGGGRGCATRPAGAGPSARGPSTWGAGRCRTEPAPRAYSLYSNDFGPRAGPARRGPRREEHTIAAHDKPTVAVTGVTGALGSRIAARLADRGVPQLLVARDPSRLPELPGAQHRGPAVYDDAEAMQQALTGADTLVLISSHPTGKRLEEHATAAEAGRAAGVRRVLYVSLIGAGPIATYRNARDHWLTEQYLAGSGMRHTIFRAGIYASTPAALADDELVIRGPGGDGRVAFATHDDIAEVIATVAADDAETAHDGQVLEVTGPESITLAECVEQIARATGRGYRYEPQTLPEAFAQRWADGVSGVQIESWISWYQAIATGELDRVTDVVPRITGSEATPVARAPWFPEPRSSR